MLPLISVVMAVYNGMPYLPEAIASLQNQTVSNWELIMVDDGSTDQTLEYLDCLTDSRLHVVRDMHVSQTHALNVGLQLCQGQFIARLDADDACLPHRFERQAAYLAARQELDGCGSWFQEMDEHGQPGRVINLFSESWEATQDRLHSFTTVPHPTYFFHRRVFDEFQYDESYLWAQDLEYLLRVTRKYKLACVPEVLVYYRRHRGQIMVHHGAAQTSEGRKAREKWL